MTTAFLALGWACTGFWALHLYRVSVRASRHAVEALWAKRMQQEKSEEYLHEIITLKRKLAEARADRSQPPTHSGQGGVL